MAASITITLPGKSSEQVEVGHVATIGRAPQSDICLAGDPRVSRQHAVIRCTNGVEYQLIDLGSRNGTFVNGAQVVLPVPLHDGTRIRIGATEMVFCLAQADAGGEHPDSTIGATVITQSVEILEAAILVCDVRGFSSCSEKLPPNEVSQFIGSWFRIVGDVIARHGGCVDKFLGDAVLAFWVGAAAESCAPAFAACEEMREAARQLHWPRLGIPLTTAVALHHGRVTQGNVGIVAQRDATIMGAAVNVTFRLEAACKPLGYAVLCSGDFYRPLAPLPDFQDGGEIPLKGMSNPMQVFGKV